MKQFKEAYDSIVNKYNDCIKIGFIAGLGVSLIIVSYAFLQHTKTVQREIFQIRANIQAEVIAKAEYTCSGRVQAFRQTDEYFQVICEWQ